MKLGFLIIAHSEPDQVARLVRALGPAADEIRVHVNARSDLAPFAAALPAGVGLVRDRVPVQWGSVTLWEAALAGVRELLRETSVERIVLLSQSCYPLVSGGAIRRFFAAVPEAEFISGRPLLRQATGLWRLRHDFHRDRFPLALRRGWVGAGLRRLGLCWPMREWRAPLRGLQPRSGCMWWALTRNALEHIVEGYDTRPGLKEYAGHLFGPEEIIPHTLLTHSPFASAIRHHLTYEDWSRGGPHPKWLDEDDVRRITAPGFVWRTRFARRVPHAPLFARKFGGPAGAAACDWLDEGGTRHVKPET